MALARQREIVAVQAEVSHAQLFHTRFASQICLNRAGVKMLDHELSSSLPGKPQLMMYP